MATVDRGYWNQLQSEQEQRYGLPPGLLNRIAGRESSYSSDVLSGQRRGSSGEWGAYQFMPETARNLGIDPLDPVSATEGAARLMRENLDRRGGDLRLAIADYNAGPGVTNAVLAGRRDFKPITVDYMASFEDFYGGNPTPNWATLQQSPPSEAPPGRSMAATQLPSASPPPPSGAGGPSQLDAIMMELLQPPPPRERSPWDAIQMLGMGILSSQNPQAFQGMAMLQNMIEGQERAERQERQDRAMMALQYASLQNKGQREPSLIQTARIVQREPELAPIVQTIAGLQRPAPQPQFSTDAQGNPTVWDPTTQTTRFVPSEARPAPVTPEQQREQEIATRRTNRQIDDAIKNRPAAEEDNFFIEEQLRTTQQILDGLKQQSVSGPYDRLMLSTTNPELDDLMELAYSDQVIDRLSSLAGAASDKDVEYMRKGIPSNWRLGKGGEKAVKEYFNRRLKYLQRRLSSTRDKISGFDKILGDEPRSWADPIARPDWRTDSSLALEPAQPGE